MYHFYNIQNSKETSQYLAQNLEKYITSWIAHCQSYNGYVKHCPLSRISKTPTL